MFCYVLPDFWLAIRVFEQGFDRGLEDLHQLEDLQDLEDLNDLQHFMDLQETLPKHSNPANR